MKFDAVLAASSVTDPPEAAASLICPAMLAPRSTVVCFDQVGGRIKSHHACRRRCRSLCCCASGQVHPARGRIRVCQPPSRRRNDHCDIRCCIGGVDLNRPQAYGFDSQSHFKSLCTRKVTMQFSNLLLPVCNSFFDCYKTALCKCFAI